MHPKDTLRQEQVPVAAGAVPERLSAWLVETFIPAWVARAWQPGLQGYVEKVSWPDGAAVGSARHSTMVTGRLVYTFSLCHVLGGAAPCLAAAAHGVDVLLGACRLPDGGFAHLLEADGSVADARGDLYDLAFVLLGLGGYVAASGCRDLLEITEEIGSHLDLNHADPLGGYREKGADGGPRRQFPQMHLFEAFQLLARLSPNQGWERRADAILDLVEHRLVGADGGIDEWYDAEWRPGETGHAVEREVGHQFEWSWLLYRHSWSAGVPRAMVLADKVYGYGRVAMRPAAGTTIGPLSNRIDAAGRALDATQPMWPLAELLRAAVAAGVAGRSGDGGETAEAVLRALFAHYIDRDSGLWINELGLQANCVHRIVPVRVLYHLIPAFAAFARERESAFRIRNPILDRYDNRPKGDTTATMGNE